jgi:hypothetical protein
VRRATATSPGTGQLFELTEFKGVERTPLQTRLQDPGSVRLQVMVRGINEVTAAITRAGGAILSDGGVRASLPPNLWGITVRMPDNVYMSLLEPCGDCAPNRPTAAQPPGASASNAPPVPSISGAVTGPAKCIRPGRQRRGGLGAGGGFPHLTEEYFVTGTANDAPHTTRIIVRRPKDPSQLSGTVVAEAPTPAAGRSSSSGRACRSRRGATCSWKSCTARRTSACSRRSTPSATRRWPSHGADQRDPGAGRAPGEERRRRSRPTPCGR